MSKPKTYEHGYDWSEQFAPGDVTPAKPGAPSRSSSPTGPALTATLGELIEGASDESNDSLVRTYAVWHTKNGSEIPLVEMAQGHLENLFGYLERKVVARAEGRPVEGSGKHAARWLRAVNAELARRAAARSAS